MIGSDEKILSGFGVIGEINEKWSFKKSFQKFSSIRRTRAISTTNINLKSSCLSRQMFDFKTQSL